MELCDQTLRQFTNERKKKHKNISEIEVVNIIYELLQGVNWLNKNKIIHRDIKPDNVIRNIGGDWKLCDYGFAKLTENMHE